MFPELRDEEFHLIRLKNDTRSAEQPPQKIFFPNISDWYPYSGIKSRAFIRISSTMIRICRDPVQFRMSTAPVNGCHISILLCIYVCKINAFVNFQEIKDLFIIKNTCNRILRIVLILSYLLHGIVWYGRYTPMIGHRAALCPSAGSGQARIARTTSYLDKLIVTINCN